MSVVLNREVESIWKDFHARLRRFIASRVSDPESADDILQEVFVRIHSHIDTLRDERRVESWIYQITRNAVIDYYREQKPRAELDEALAMPEEDTEGDTARELASGLKAMVGSLPREYRDALLLAEFEGLTQKELAERVGISISGAKSRVQRAREKLKKMLLDCCHFEFDRLGQVIDYYPRADVCGCCGCAPAVRD